MARLTDPKVHMGTLTGGEGRAAYASNPVILLPLGSHEDQGPHAPMGDYLLAERMAELIALKATAEGTPCFVAPVLPFGGADYFGPMVGGIAIEPSTLVMVLSDVVASLHRNGLTRIVVINGHGGNVGPVGEVARQLWQDQQVLMPSLYLWRIAYALLPGLIGAEKAKKVSGHGADPLSSLGLHLLPELQRPDLVPDGKPLKTDSVLGLPYTGLGAVSFEGAEIGMPMEYDDSYNDGVAAGDPRLSSAETGRVLSGKLVEIGARFVSHFAAKVG